MGSGLAEAQHVYNKVAEVQHVCIVMIMCNKKNVVLAIYEAHVFQL